MIYNSTATSGPVLYFIFFFFYFFFLVKNNSTLHRWHLQLNATTLFGDAESPGSNCFIGLTILDLQALELLLRAIKRGNV